MIQPALAASPTQKKQLALEKFAAAESQRQELAARPAGKRTQQDYQQVIDAYRRVYYLAPTSSKADDSVNAVAQLLAESGRQFKDTRSLQAAITQYEFLRREYPGSRYRIEALLAMAQICKNDLHDREQAKLHFQEFLEQIPAPSAGKGSQRRPEGIGPSSACAGKARKEECGNGRPGDCPGSPRSGLFACCSRTVP